MTSNQLWTEELTTKSLSRVVCVHLEKRKHLEIITTLATVMQYLCVSVPPSFRCSVIKQTNKQTKKVDIGSTAALQCTKHCECMLCTPLPDTGHHYYTITILSCWDFSHGKFRLLFPRKASGHTVTLPAYGACWVFWCSHNPLDSDKDSGVLNMCTGVNACSCMDTIRVCTES